jgi:hypothetical protein
VQLASETTTATVEASPISSTLRPRTISNFFEVFGSPVEFYHLRRHRKLIQFTMEKQLCLWNYLLISDWNEDRQFNWYGNKEWDKRVINKIINFVVWYLLLVTHNEELYELSFSLNSPVLLPTQNTGAANQTNFQNSHLRQCELQSPISIEWHERCNNSWNIFYLFQIFSADDVYFNQDHLCYYWVALWLFVIGLHFIAFVAVDFHRR